ncbi:MAG: hypothetical protein BroJett014_11260 [Planctomycetota bacterium]|nr:hypothetical protein [Planctomycetota bacterium]GIK52153.1 MAG: hypothetical protein BroJett014_11260 [Planctomycetota bacterium]
MTRGELATNRRLEVWRSKCVNVELVKYRMSRSNEERLTEWIELKVGGHTRRLTVEELERVHLVTFRYIADSAHLDVSDDSAAS